MVCEHLIALEEEIKSKCINETFRGRAWSLNCREWVYFDCCFDFDTIKRRLNLDNCVIKHEHLGTHDGQELGFYCSICHDGIIGYHPKSRFEITYYR
jgi:hypothetical protein